jgi:WD40 repeat protein
MQAARIAIAFLWLTTVLQSAPAYAAGPSRQRQLGLTDVYVDPLPAGALARVGTVRFRLGASPIFTPDGKAVLAGGADGAIRVYDAATGKELRCFVGHRRFVISLALTADARFLASCSHDHIRVWDFATGKQLRQFDRFNPLSKAPRKNKLANCVLTQLSILVMTAVCRT